MHFMVLLSCHNLHVVVLVVTIHSNKQPHIIEHCETNYTTKQNVRKQNKTKVLKQLSSNLLHCRLPERRKRSICLLVLHNNTTPAGFKSFLLYTINIIFVTVHNSVLPKFLLSR